MLTSQSAQVAESNTLLLRRRIHPMHQTKGETVVQVQDSAAVFLNLSSTTPPLSNCPLFQAPPDFKSESAKASAFIGRFIYQTFLVVGRVRARAPPEIYRRSPMKNHCSGAKKTHLTTRRSIHLLNFGQLEIPTPLTVAKKLNANQSLMLQVGGHLGLTTPRVVSINLWTRVYKSLNKNLFNFAVHHQKLSVDVCGAGVSPWSWSFSLFHTGEWLGWSTTSALTFRFSWVLWGRSYATTHSEALQNNIRCFYRKSVIQLWA